MDVVLGRPVARERDPNANKVNECPQGHLCDIQAKDSKADCLWNRGSVNMRDR